MTPCLQNATTFSASWLEPPSTREAPLPFPQWSGDCRSADVVASDAPEVIEQVKQIGSGNERVMCCLDSNYANEHVPAEL